ncbi:KR domain-containing protein, partial [Actinophytocola xanthii]|uniref:KR domain-containing protein n=1 Tax=Actinophytocola xanthii TaxID=1912961 RepID=UPI001178B42E
VTAGPADDAPDPEQRAVWGCAGTRAAGGFLGLVDLPASPADPRLFPRLAAVLAAGGGEDRIAVRSGRTLALRLARTDPPPGPAWRPGGTVLVVEGGHPLGAHLVRWLAGNGAERLVLASAEGWQTPGVAELAGELRLAGVAVLVEACDLADRDQAAALLEQITTTGRLSAVVHAGQPDPDEDAERRIAAVGNLDELTAELDAFVLLSTLDLAAAPDRPAEAYLEALAERRAAAGLPATAVRWGARPPADWAPGMAPDLAVLALRHAVTGGRPVATIADVRWEAPEVPRDRRFAALAEPPADAGTPVDEGAGAELRQRLDRMPAVGRPAAVLELVFRHTGLVLGFGPGDLPSPDTAFRELGFDSVSGVELRNRLGAATGVNLPATLVFEHPTPAALAEHLLARLYPQARAAGEDVLGTIETALDGLDPAVLHPAELDRLRRVVHELGRLVPPPRAADPEPAMSEDISDDDLFRFIDQKLGRRAS